LDAYTPQKVRTNKQFEQFDLADFEKVYMPDSMRPFSAVDPVSSKEFIADDNRSAIFTKSYTQIDGTDFYLSVKGVGSTTNPFSRELLRKEEICGLVDDARLKELVQRNKESSSRYLTAELWQRFSPYGGQGIEHAEIAMHGSELADMTSIHGFRIAPLVKINCLPDDVERQIRKVYWYRRFEGRMVQEARLVPSNVRVYFHSGKTVGGTMGYIYNLFGIDTNEKAISFLLNYVKSGLGFLTILSRSLQANNDGTYNGLDLYDIWLDKDAVIAPDGTVFCVDLEGLDWLKLNESDAKEKVYYQIFRSLYEFSYGYEQIERERCKRFGGTTDRKIQFLELVKEALKTDEILTLEHDGDNVMIRVDNIIHEQRLVGKFPITTGTARIVRG
jgi:hypothetical protein